ncbi:hypothetical protein TrVGV298_008402 [Trichoderma virens]|nr:hypothetical protein TrVGV298_008402 [Trichoderma virens]
MLPPTHQMAGVDQEEMIEPKLSYTWTYWYARFTELNEYEYLPCPVETQGAHLISAPSSPNAVESRHDASSFCVELSNRLRRLVLRQSIRENIYGEEFANEWPISRTPRALANEIRIARRKARDALLHLDSPSTSDSEYEPPWRRRIREVREKRRQARRQAKAQAKAQVESEVQPQAPAKASAQLSPKHDAKDLPEQPVIHAMMDLPCKKRKAPPTPITPSPKKTKVL